MCFFNTFDIFKLNSIHSIVLVQLNRLQTDNHCVGQYCVLLMLVERKGGWQKIDLSAEHSVRVMMENVVVIGPLAFPMKEKEENIIKLITILSTV